MRKRSKLEFQPRDNGDGSALVPLGNGLFSVIDSFDIERVAFLAWSRSLCRDGQQYAVANLVNAEGKWGMVKLHRVLLCFPFQQIDHIDGNGLNNRRSNLRLCNNHQNQWNCRKKTTGKYSAFKGVTRHCIGDLWKCQLMKNRKSVHAKYFKSEIEAARSYDAAAIFHFGEFAATNVSLGLLPPLCDDTEES
jgi:hypothetical protein